MAERWEASQTAARLQPSRELATDQPVDVRRYANALRRSRLLIALIVTGLSALVLTLSLALPKTYKATSRILLDDSPGFGESTDVERRLATIRTLLTTRDVLARAARQLDGESTATLEDKVHASVDAKANIINLQATDSSPSGAAEIANAVAAAFLAKQRSSEQRRLARASASLRRAIARLRGSPGARSEIEAIRERLSELSVSQASAGSELQLAEAARPSGDPDSPRPVRNTIFAFFAGLFMAVLVALGRERIAPRVSGPRHLSELSGLPVLAEIAQTRRRRFGGDGRLASARREAYQTLSALIDLQLESARQHTILVTSAIDDEGKAEVTAALARALALAGEKTLLIVADMRRHAAEHRFDDDSAPGLAEILSAPTRERRETAAAMLAHPASSVSAGDGAGSLAVLGAGHAPANPARLLSAEALDVFFKELARSGYTYVLIEGPPVLGPVDCRFWAQRVDGMLLVSRPDRLEPNDVIAVRELLERLDVSALGHVVNSGGPI